MVFNFADDSRNLVFRKGVDSVDYIQNDYYIAFKSMYSNKWLLNNTPPNKFYSGGMFLIKLTKVDDNDTYISFSWDSTDIDGFGTALPTSYNEDDIDGYYILSLRGANILPSPVYTKEISQHVCKVINDRSTNTSQVYTINIATKEQEEGGEYIYYRG